jgi:2-hydroxychromene-2-carboxylate isomerase
MTGLEFWYDFHSPWAYLAATRIGDLAARHGLALAWRPLHLPKLIQAIGGRRPLEENSAFVSWYKQDLQDWAQRYGMLLRYHPDYPLKPARALRAAIRAGEQGAAGRFALGVFRAYWTDSRDISDLNVLGGIAAACGLDSAAIMEAAVDEAYRRRLAANTAEAIDRGVFGVPTVLCQGKLFFGNDRLEFLEYWLGRAGS